MTNQSRNDKTVTAIDTASAGTASFSLRLSAMKPQTTPPIPMIGMSRARPPSTNAAIDITFESDCGPNPESGGTSQGGKFVDPTGPPLMPAAGGSGEPVEPAGVTNGCGAAAVAP